MPSATGWSTAASGSRRPTLLDDAAVDAIEALADLAPLHNPLAAATIRAAAARSRTCRTSPPSTPPSTRRCPRRPRRYPVPAAWRTDAGIRRYGFHGLSVDVVGRRAAELLDRPADDARGSSSRTSAAAAR